MFEHVHAAAARNLFVIASVICLPCEQPTSWFHSPLLLLLPLEVFIDNSIEKWQAAHMAYA